MGAIMSAMIVLLVGGIMVGNVGVEGPITAAIASAEAYTEGLELVITRYPAIVTWQLPRS